MFVSHLYVRQRRLAIVTALLLNTQLLVTSLGLDAVPMAGIAIRSRGSTAERVSQALIEHKTLQEERRRPFLAQLDSVFLLIFNAPSCFHSSVTDSSCSRPCNGCFHSHPWLLILCNYYYNRAGVLSCSPTLESMTRSSDVA